MSICVHSASFSSNLHVKSPVLTHCFSLRVEVCSHFQIYIHIIQIQAELRIISIDFIFSVKSQIKCSVLMS